MQTLARAANPPDDLPPKLAGGAKVLVLDTGLSHKDYRPNFVGAIDSRSFDDVDRPNENPTVDDFVDPAAGHGTFIAGIIERIAPRSAVTVDRVLTTFGHGDDADIALVIEGLSGAEIPDILSMSFSAFTENDEPPLAITDALRNIVEDHGVVAVASAGNDAQCRKAWPAAQPEVIGVAAVGITGPAQFSNFGPWVTACAPGVDILSRFFDSRKTPLPTDDSDQPFEGWATWSGTSFAAPGVVGAIAARMATAQISAQEAAQAVVHDAHLMRLPGYGTVVNVA